LFGTLEGVTSEFLDPYGYNLAEASIGGPLVKNKASFFLGGTYINQADSNPSWRDIPVLKEDVQARVNENPQQLILAGPDGAVDIDFPSSIPVGSVLDYDQAAGHPNYYGSDGEVHSSCNGVAGCVIRFTTPDGGTTDLLVDELGDGINLEQLRLSPDGELLSLDDFERRDARYAPYERLAFNGNISYNLSPEIRVRLGGRTFHSQTGGVGGGTSSLMNAESYLNGDSYDWQGFVTWNHRLSNSTFYQIQVDYDNNWNYTYRREFGRDIGQTLFYGDLENPANASLAKYKVFAQRDVDGDGANDVVLDTAAEDGTTGGIAALFGLGYGVPGLVSSGYSKGRNSQFRVTAEATTQVGLHQIQFGAEYEQSENRFYSVSTFGLSRFYNDDEVETQLTDDNGAPYAINEYTDFRFRDFKNRITQYGYNYLGTEETDTEDLDDYFYAANSSKEVDPSLSSTAPYRPIFYGGFVQDKIEYKDLVLNLGLRVDVYDANTYILKDPYSLQVIQRASDITGAPSNIGGDYAVLYPDGNRSAAVAGYRDLEGNLYDANGQSIGDGDLANVNARVSPESFTDRDGNVVTRISGEAFKDSEPNVTIMPRIGMSFPVTDQALFFARYGVTSQSPGGVYKSVLDFQRTWEGSGDLQANGALKPARTIEYEIGFRQRIGQRMAFTLSGFYRQQKDQRTLRILRNTFPSSTYTSVINADFASLKGVEIGFDMRRTNNLSINANYTLSYAEGTGSASGSFGVIAWLFGPNSTWPNWLSRLDFDQRHVMNVVMDYRLGEGQGPDVFGTKLLQNFGANMVVKFGSGFPYTGRNVPVSFLEGPARFTGTGTGEINNEEAPSTLRVDLKVDRAIPVGGADVKVFLEVQNLFDTRNVRGVWPVTGLPNDDGYLSTARGQNAYPSELSQAMYGWRIDNEGNYGIPRTTRLGVRLTF
jgi:hypothetical protein